MPDETKDTRTQVESSPPNPSADPAIRDTIEHLDDELADRLDVEPTGDVKG